ncbi:MAG: TylF/MycF/NovP-related O-methyltransferase [Gammaproteobacteria bacterium]
MNFLRRVAMSEAILNVSTAVRYESGELTREQSLKGDYVEFGVYKGRMFGYVMREAAERMPWMRFVACDSFEGLPAPKGVDVGGEFAGGQFACSELDFLKNLSSQALPLDGVITIPGWFSESLLETNVAKYSIHSVAIAYVDCDLYESCVPVLSFLTPRVRQGTVLMFDDWFCFRADPRRGIPLAVTEWLKRAPHLELVPWRAFASHGFAFFVNVH